MTVQNPTINLPLLVIARVCTTAVFMVYPASLGVLRQAWDMSATKAGMIQGGFTIAMAMSLLLTSHLCDKHGAQRVFVIASLASAAAALLAAAFARNFESALLTFVLVGITQGGTYTPAIMLASSNADPKRKNTAVGWVLAGMSGGYVVSIVTSNLMIEFFDYRLAFLAVALISIVGSILSVIATQNVKSLGTAKTKEAATFPPFKLRSARLLLLGYIGHTWELLGMWAWIPAFLAVALTKETGMSGVEIGVWTALALHASGFFASFLAGNVADRIGTRPVLLSFGLLGCICSLCVGWMINVPEAILITFVAAYGFATIGDSAVLSSAMTEAVPQGTVGRVLGVRSVLGIGAGSVAPVTFGAVLDAAPLSTGWGYGFTALALGGGLSAICAFYLPDQNKQQVR